MKGKKGLCMGPIILFDKSFIQSLSIDESVWLEHFYLCNICPLFYVETLADLAKEMINGRLAEEVVGNIADKFPQSGTPNLYHENICLGNLLGNRVPMNGQIIVGNATHPSHAEQNATIILQTPEEDAFLRWQRREFAYIEREYAHDWRCQMSNFKLEDLIHLLDIFPLEIESLKRVEDIVKTVQSFVKNPAFFRQQLSYMVTILKIPSEYYRIVLAKWGEDVSISDFAPYSAYCMLIDLIFIISMKRGFISTERSSNRTDIAYLNYLPFTNVFVSGDKLHKMLTPLILRTNQEFIRGEDLKQDLKNINNYYMQLPDEVKSRGIYYFASEPPEECEGITLRLWKKYYSSKPNKSKYIEPRHDENLKQKLSGFMDSNHSVPNPNFDPNNPDYMIVPHEVKKRKGSWNIYPEESGN